LTGGSLRVFSYFSRLEVVSDKMVLSRPAHQQVTRAVGQLTITVSVSFGKSL